MGTDPYPSVNQFPAIGCSNPTVAQSTADPADGICDVRETRLEAHGYSVDRNTGKIT